jgi:hypothetical protein
MLNTRYLYQVNGQEDDNTNLDTFENNKDFGQSVLTLQEALMTFEFDTESELFHLKQLRKVIRIRKTAVTVDDQERIIVMIRDLTDSAQVDLIKLKSREENCSQKMIS